MAINFKAPLNSLSFGHVSFKILEELHKRNTPVNLFLTQDPADISAFSAPEDLQFYLSSAARNAKKDYSKKDPGFQLWHIVGSENSISNEQTLLTFHEVDALTPQEINILKNQKSVLVSSKFSERVFRAHGVTNVRYCPLGFDSTHFKPVKRKLTDDNKISFSLFGKYEKRKNTEKVIRAWLAKYGKDSRFQLNLHVFNPFFSPEQNNQLLVNIFGGPRPYNVNCLKYVNTLAELNDSLNATDIVLDMSGGEGFSIPSFSALALGKHGVVHKCSSIADWADDSGAVCVLPSGTVPVYDGVFFREGEDKNQGNLFDWNVDDFISGCDLAVEKFRASKVNAKGLKLQQKYTWEKTADIILEEVNT